MQLVLLSQLQLQNKPAAAYREPSVFKPQSNNFEFKVGQPTVQASKFSVNPFAAAPKLQPAAANDSARMADQVLPSPEPATPASVTSESRGGPAAPPVATYASISKGASPTDSGTVTPLVNMHASHVPLSTYTGSPDLAAAVAASKRPSKVNYSDILLWKEPLQTATIFIAGTAGFALLNFAAYGAHNMTLMSGAKDRGKGWIITAVGRPHASKRGTNAHMPGGDVVSPPPCTQL